MQFLRPSKSEKSKWSFKEKIENLIRTSIVFVSSNINLLKVSGSYFLEIVQFYKYLSKIQWNVICFIVFISTITIFNENSITLRIFQRLIVRQYIIFTNYEMSEQKN